MPWDAPLELRGDETARARSRAATRPRRQFAATACFPCANALGALGGIEHSLAREDADGFPARK
eukprot:3820927-Pyramimonas_sp.AAC.2